MATTTEAKSTRLPLSRTLPADVMHAAADEAESGRDGRGPANATAHVGVHLARRLATRHGARLAKDTETVVRTVGGIIRPKRHVLNPKRWLEGVQIRMGAKFAGRTVRHASASLGSEDTAKVLHKVVDAMVPGPGIPTMDARVAAMPLAQRLEHVVLEAQGKKPPKVKRQKK